MKISTSIRTLAIAASLLLTANAAQAGDGTKTSPYSVAELNAQKEALAASGDTVWVKADLKGLGEDGTRTDNADTTDENNKTVKNMAALFGNDTDSFTAYSWQILGQLALSDLTNTKDLLIALTYGTTAHPYGNTANPQYASNDEPETPHFSLVEVHNALSVDIKTGLRGYHIASSYIVPQNVVAVKVAAGYSASKGAYVNYTDFDGATQTYVTPKDGAFVLKAAAGTYDFVLTAALYEQTMSNGNNLSGGTQAGVNSYTTKNRTRLRFVADETKPGFQRNSTENCTVTLDSKDEVYLQVNSLATNFYGNYSWETEEQDWISWGGGAYSDSHALFDFKNNNMNLPIGSNTALNAGDLAGKSVPMSGVTLTAANGNTATRYFNNSSKGYHLQVFKSGSFTLTAGEGKAIKAVIITLQTGSSIGATADKGTLGDFDADSKSCTWNGNATSVTFTFTATRYIYAITAVTADADDDTVTTGVQTVKAGRPAVGTGAIYDLQGRRVVKPSKGIYVKDGRKIFIK